MSHSDQNSCVGIRLDQQLRVVWYLPGPAANKTVKTAIWTISINYFRLYFQVSELHNSYKEAFPDVLVAQFKLGKSNNP